MGCGSSRVKFVMNPDVPGQDEVAVEMFELLKIQQNEVDMLFRIFKDIDLHSTGITLLPLLLFLVSNVKLIIRLHSTNWIVCIYQYGAGKLWEEYLWSFGCWSVYIYLVIYVVLTTHVLQIDLEGWISWSLCVVCGICWQCLSIISERLLTWCATLAARCALFVSYKLTKFSLCCEYFFIFSLNRCDGERGLRDDQSQEDGRQPRHSGHLHGTKGEIS